jgi:hypothetical protein
MRLLILSFLFISLSLFSCKKKEINFKLKGNVTALNSGGNLQGVNIKVYTVALGTSFEDLKGSTQTDASGNYELDIERSKFEKLIIKLNKNNYFENSKIYLFDDLSTENENNTNHILSPKSYTRFILKNSLPNDTNDELKIFKVSGKTDCEECCPDGTTYYNGKVDTVVVCANDGDSYMKFYWWVNGNEQYGVDSVYNTPFSTIDYTIDY